MSREITCDVCPWYWKEDDDGFAHCQYPYDDGDAPCEWDDYTEEV